MGWVLTRRNTFKGKAHAVHADAVSHKRATSPISIAGVFCPKCGDEYREGFTECADCGVPLTAEPPVPPGEREHSGPLVIVHEAYGPVEAGLIQSVLEGSGIHCALGGSGLGDSAYPFSVGFMARVPVMVLQDDEERARDLIRAALAGELEP